jgi:hypothetical protein
LNEQRGQTKLQEEDAAMSKDRFYTNLILTVIAILLALSVFRPAALFIGNAQATEEQQRARQMAINVIDVPEVAKATREIAVANQAIASAIQSLAESVDRVSHAISTMPSSSK